MSVIRAPRVPYLIVVDGKSDANFYRYYYKVADSIGMNIHMAVENARAGGPIDTLNRCIKLKLGRFSEVPQGNVAIVPDSELYEQTYLDDIERKSRENGVKVFFQEPCLECLILAHFDQTLRFSSVSCNECQTLLKRIIPDYEKGYETRKYVGRILPNHMLAAAETMPSHGRLLNFLGMTSALQRSC